MRTLRAPTRLTRAARAFLLRRLGVNPRIGDLMADLGSILRYKRLFLPLYQRHPVPTDTRVVGLRLAPLGGRPIFVRPGTSDGEVVWETFAGMYHLPPVELGPAPRIWDLGANIGLTMAHFAVLYPEATITGVELAPANAAICRQNIAHWGNRCVLVEAAVWPMDGEIAYLAESGNEYGVHVVEGGSSLDSARALSLESLHASEGGVIDYVKMDIEGAERGVLRRRTGWAAFVRAIKVEVHAPYTVEECVHDLTRLGFTAAVDDRHENAVSGTRAR